MRKGEGFVLWEKYQEEEEEDDVFWGVFEMENVIFVYTSQVS